MTATTETSPIAASRPPLKHLRPIGNAAAMALLNLSLLVAVGTLSAAPLGRAGMATGIAAAVLACVVGGIIVSLLAGAPGEVTAPASSVAVIYATLGTDLLARAGGQTGVAHLWGTLSMAVVMMGVLLVLAGSLVLPTPSSSCRLPSAPVS